MTSTISILTAAWNEEATIGRFLDSFQQLRYPNKHLILCAGGTDTTWTVAQAHAAENITLLEQVPGEGKQRALHRALTHVKGEIVFLTDADCIMDDDSFERIITPLLAGDEQVTTGRARPYAHLLGQPFVMLQAANNAYNNSVYTESYTDGVLGSNCGVTLTALRHSGGLGAEASTGTDYVLAKMLLKAGYRIRAIPKSQIQTEYPVLAKAYMRQQRRWLRNIAWHGWRFGVMDEVCKALISSAVGVMMLGLPFVSIMWPPLWLVTIAIWGYAGRARLHYLHAGAGVLGFRPNTRHFIHIPYHMLLDFAAWSSVLLDYVSAERRTRW